MLYIDTGMVSTRGLLECCILTQVWSVQEVFWNVVYWHRYGQYKGSFGMLYIDTGMVSTRGLLECCILTQVWSVQEVFWNVVYWHRYGQYKGS